MLVVVPAFLLIAAAAPPLQPVVPAVTRDCMDLRRITNSRMLPGAYEVRVGGDWWRNTADCPMFARNRTMITQTPTGRLCRGDIAQVVEPLSRFDYGSCGLGNWTKLAPAPAPVAGGR